MVRKRKRRDNFFSEMSDTDLILYVKENYQGRGIAEVQKSDSSLYSFIRKRALSDVLVEKRILVRRIRKNGTLSDMSDDELVQYIEDNFSGRSITHIEDNDPTVCGHIRKRDLTERLVREGTLTYLGDPTKRRNKNPKRHVRFDNFTQWRSYGIERGYNERNPSGLEKSRNSQERSWFKKGQTEGWKKKFSFKKKRRDDSFRTFGSWNKYGKERTYSELNRGEIQRVDSGWYQKGGKEGWLDRFPFKKVRRSPFLGMDFEKWKSHGMKRGYSEINPSSLAKSEEFDERNWYNRGRTGGWLNDFPFQRLIAKKKKSDKQIKQFLEATPEAQSIVSLATVTERTGDIAKILVQLWPERFPKDTELARMLPEVVERTGKALLPFTLERASYYVSEWATLPHEVRYCLEDVVYGIVVDQYQRPFNDDPDGTLRELKQFASQGGEIQGLAKRVLGYYKDVYSFSIPGHGKLRDVA